jgi:coenzyme F420-reducing hydrogenase gamma subunit
MAFFAMNLYIMDNNKKKVGIFSFTCDEGCSIYLIEIFNKKLEEWLPKMEIKYFLSVKERAPLKDFDIVLIEGVVGTEKEKKELEEIRANTKILIAMGTCAMTSQPSGQRNKFNEEQMAEIRDDISSHGFLPKCLALKEVVKVDDEIPGCPILEQKFIEVFEKYLN